MIYLTFTNNEYIQPLLIIGLAILELYQKKHPVLDQHIVFDEIFELWKATAEPKDDEAGLRSSMGWWLEDGLPASCK